MTNTNRVVVHITQDSSATPQTIASSTGYFTRAFDNHRTNSIVVDQLEVGENYYFVVEAQTSAQTRHLSSMANAVVQPPAKVTGTLNDTGNTSFYFRPQDDSAVASNSEVYLSQAFAGQDSRVGRDVTVTNADKLGSGVAGFDFSYLSGDGTVTSTAGAADCIRDNVTGLVWELKTASNYDHTYVWKDTNLPLAHYSNGYFKKIAELQTPEYACDPDATVCTTEEYVNAVNAVGLCGGSDWRLPSAQELEGIIALNDSHNLIHYNPSGVSIGSRRFAVDPMFNRGSVSGNNYSVTTTLFLNTTYWTSSRSVSQPAIVNFKTGEVWFDWFNVTVADPSHWRHAIRLVRGGK